jgi:ATP-binding cassette subfamily B protein
VAISRVFMRESAIKIALFDEATSALDAASERFVMDALDQARIGRTTLVVAHRLSTIRDADIIFVLHHGKIVEQGSHADLLSRGGHYFELVSQQMGTSNA